MKNRKDIGRDVTSEDEPRQAATRRVENAAQRAASLPERNTHAGSNSIDPDFRLRFRLLWALVRPVDGENEHQQP